MSASSLGNSAGMAGGYGKPGDYGRNAAVQYQKLLQSNPQAAEKATITYTNPQQPKWADALGYAENDIKLFDKDKNGTLDIGEVRQAFGQPADKPNEVADKLFNTIDTDKNGQIDTLEQASYVLFQDHAKGPLLAAAQASGNSGLLADTQTNAPLEQGRAQSQSRGQELQDQINALAPGDTQADGRITQQERAFADGMILSAPTLSGEVLNQFKEKLRPTYEQGF